MAKDPAERQRLPEIHIGLIFFIKDREHLVQAEEGHEGLHILGLVLEPLQEELVLPLGEKQTRNHVKEPLD